MLRSVIQSSLKSRYVVIVLAAAVMLFGIRRLREMPVDILPEFSPPYVEIQTEALGLSAEEVEELITLGMEQDLLNGVPWLDTIRSESLPGLSDIVLVFKPGTDLLRARQMVAERMTQAYVLPHVSKPPIMLQPTSATSRVMIVGLSSKTLSPIQVSILARWTIMPRLKGIPGVANVAIWGQRDRQLQVQVDPQRLQANGVTLQKVLETTGNALWVSSLSFVEASTPGTGGFIDTANQRLGIRHVLPIVSAEALSEVPIEGTSKRLGEVADVVEDHQPLIGDALTNNGSGLLMVIEKFPGANTAEVTEQVETALHEMLPGLPGVDVDTSIFRPADFIDVVRQHLTTAILAGLVLLLLVVGAFFAEWRATLTALVAVPLSLLTAAIVLDLMGATLNMVVVTGLLIAIGVIVFDAITNVENILRRIRESGAEGRLVQRARIIFDAVLEARSGMMYALIVLLLAVSPILFLEGKPSAFFKPLALAYVLAILASLLVASLVTPALGLILLANAHIGRRPSALAARVRRSYEHTLLRMAPRGGVAFVLAVVLAVVSVFLLTTSHRSVLPYFKERNLAVHLDCLPGTSQPEMSRISNRVADEIRGIPGVNEVGAHIGRAVLGDQTVDVQSAELWVNIDPDADYEQTTAVIQRVVDGYPGVGHHVETYLREKSEDVVAGAEDNLVIRIYGEREDGLRQRAQEVRKAIDGIGGIVESKTVYPVQQATLEARVNMTAAQRHGLKPGDVRRAAATLVAGVQVGNLYEEQKVFEVVVWSTPQTRHSLSDVAALMIDTPDGGQVRLGDVADLHIVPASTVIRHDAVKRYIDVVADVQNRGLDAVAADVQHELAQLQFPLEYHAEVLGDYAQQQAMRRRMIAFGIAAAIGALVVLQAAFGSWRLAALYFLTFPAALSGGLVAAALLGGLSFGAWAGLLAVFGIATYDMVALIRHCQRIEREEGATFDLRLVLRAAGERYVPLLLTSLAAAAVFVPALFLGDRAGLEVVRPMAFVVLGGLLSSGLVHTLLLPALYLGLGVAAAEETDPLAESRDAAMGAMPEARRAAGD